MTIREKLHQLLTGRGLWPGQADAIIEAYADTDEAGMAQRLDDDMEGYPPPLFPAVWLSVQFAAANWLKANAPQHWARPMFDNTSHVKTGD